MMKRVMWLCVVVLMLTGQACQGCATNSPTPSPTVTVPPTPTPTYSREEAIEFARAVSAIRTEREVLEKDIDAFSKSSSTMAIEDALRELDGLIKRESDLQVRMSEIERPSIPSARAVQDAYLIAFTRDLIAMRVLQEAIAGDQDKLSLLSVVNIDAMVYSDRAEQTWNRLLETFSITEAELK
ncbi:MAG: hypothetical protein V1894_01050 [Chloroflexota bacterium]